MPPIISFGFLLDFCAFLLEAIGTSNFEFAKFLSTSRVSVGGCHRILFPNGSGVYIPIWTIGRKRSKLVLREYCRKITWPFFFNIIFILPFDWHKAHLISCVGLSVGAWLSTHPMIIIFPISFKKILYYVAHLVGPPPSFNPWFVTLHLWVAFRSSRDPPFSLHPWWVKMGFHGVVWDFLNLLWRMRNFMFYMNRPMFFHHLPFNFHINGLTLWFWWMVSECWYCIIDDPIHLSRFVQMQFYFMGYHNSHGF